jgi:serine/threonine protein kinase
VATPPVVLEAEDTARVFGARYRVEALLGRGSFGVVHRVRDLLHDREIALKTVRRLGTDGVQGLKREFRTLATLSHRNLVRLYDLVVDDQECFFTMELVRGTDFVRWVAAAPPSERLARLRASFLELATAVGVLHGHGTLHRDLKPPNVLVEPDGRVVLLDFGVATRFGRWRTGRDRTAEVAGSIDYMAPELLSGATTSIASDWYSVGAVLFEALTGRPPYGRVRGARPVTTP